MTLPPREAALPLDAAPFDAALPTRLAEAAPHVVVLGDAVLDAWITGPSHRLSREAPVPVVEVDRTSHAAGGAANTAVNLAALGARVTLVSLVGADADGATLRSLVTTAGVSGHGVVDDPTRATAAKRRVLAGESPVARYDDVPTGPPGPAARAALGDALDAALDARPDAVVVCDYACGALDTGTVAALAGRRGSGDWAGVLVVDAHDPSRWAAAAPDVVTPNAAEAASLLGAALTGPDRVAAIEAAAGELRTASGAGAVVVTLDREGAVLLGDDGAPAHRTWARPAPESHACGAGDSFTAALSLALAVGVPGAVALELAQAAADVVVSRPGTSVCTTTELTARVAEAQGALLGADELARIVAEHRSAGRRVVFTNGCFDVVHRGHVASLNQAKRLGDVLVVALNSDAGVARLKGAGRPLTVLGDRAAVVAALSCVDHVVSFDDDTPAALLERLRPDVYAKGGDYTPAMLSETATVTGYGGRVAILDYLADRSTSALVDRIRATGTTSTGTMP